MMHLYFLFSAAAAALAAVIDWRTGEIPNWLSLGAIVVAIASHAAVGGWQDAGWAVTGAVACGVIPLVFWRWGAFGGGDVKVLAAIGAILLPLRGMEVEFYAFLAASVLAPARLAWEGRLFRVLGSTAALVANPFLPKARRRPLAPELLTQVRFGPPLFLGVALTAVVHWRA
jgi:prepilin peptidase CpaA